MNLYNLNPDLARIARSQSAVAYAQRSILDRKRKRKYLSMMLSPKYLSSIAAPVFFAASASAQPGDLNFDGALDSNDVDLLSVQIQSTTHSPAFDLDGDGVVNLEDLNVWVHELASTWFGDADLNGEFNVTDINQVFIAGKYNTGELASWSQGDWNGDLVFDLCDLLAASADGGYNQGPATDGGGGGSGVLPLTVFELFGEIPPLKLHIVRFSIGAIDGILLSWETTSRSVQLQRTSSLGGAWENVTADATPDDDGRTYVALTELTSHGFFRLASKLP